MNKFSGSVVWFSIEKGYGFIKPDNGNKDVFVHNNECKGRLPRALREGDRVQFVTNQKGNKVYATELSLEQG